MEYTIWDDFQEQSLTSKQVAILTTAQLIYYCPEHSSRDFAVYHLAPEVSWNDIEKEVNNYATT